MKNLYEKIIATVLTIILSSANLLVIGSYGITYALSDSELSEQTSTTNNANIEFNAYFENNTHIKTAETSDTVNLFVNINVKNAGYLANPQIALKNVNYKISGELENDNIQSVDKQNNKILLKQLNSGSNVTLTIPITILDKENVSLDNFSKESKVELTGTYVDGSAKENKISKEIINKLYWKGTAEATVEGELTKYIPYNVDDQYGVMLQAKINSGILNSTLPIKETQININVPEINAKKPTSVNVIANNTKSTNGKSDGIEFNKQNYTYNSETGIVTITVTNLQDSISWIKNAKDEYLVNFVFADKDTYDYVMENKLDTSVELDARIQVYNDESTTVTKNATIEMKQEEKLGNITDFEISALDYISKGQMYANYEANNKKETSYIVRYEAVINNAQLTDSVNLSQTKDELEIDADSPTLKLEDYIYNKNVIISQKLFNKILGEEGTIEIYNKNNEKIATIDNNTTKDENGNYIIDISSEDETEISIITSKPVSEGKLSIDVEKAIKTNFSYTKQQLKTATKLNTKIEARENDSTITKMVGITLKEPKNVVELSLNKTELSNIVENKNVEIRATLDTSSIDYALYKNPTLRIILPSCISKLKLNSYDIVMGNGLKIKNIQAKNENGVAVIDVKLEGTQTEYTIGAEYKGTIIVINTDITVKTLTPSIKEKIIMKYTNENIQTESENEETLETKVHFVAPTGVMLEHKISNYKENTGELSSISEKDVTAVVDVYSAERTAKIYGKILNNYGNNIKNLQILGRFPVEGNKEIETNTELGSNFSMQVNSNILLTGIETSKYTVYYSENAQATKDISNTSNGWTTTRTKNTKSYLIVTNDYTMEVGKTIEFSYDAKIPANLKYDKSSYEIYKVYYDNNSAIGNIQETKISSKIKITTGQGPELTAKITPTIETIREGQVVKMKVEVKNTGSVKAENVKLNIPLPENAEFAEISVGNNYTTAEETLKTITIGSINSGETITKNYFIKIKDEIKEISGENKSINIKNTATITADNIKQAINVEECTLNVKEGLVKIQLIPSVAEEYILQPNEELLYKIIVDKTSGEEISNLNIEVKLPDELKFITMYDGSLIKVYDKDFKEVVLNDVTYNETTKTLNIKIAKLDGRINITFLSTVQETNNNISVTAKAIVNNTEEHYSNVSENQTEKVKLEISELTSTPQYVKEKEKIKYNFKITNLGKTRVNSITIKDILPDDLTFEKVEYSYNIQNENITETNIVEENIIELLMSRPLEVNETVNITITAVANLLPDKNEKEIKNQVSISGLNFDEIKTNIVTNYIEYNSKIERPNQGEPGDAVNKITGTAWIDANKNGKRDSEEQTIPNMEVMLINKKDNSIVQDTHTGKNKIVRTDSNGVYEINNLPQGEYIVIFLYNSSMYSLTTYRAKDVDETLNSDAIDIYINFNEQKILAGMSDAIKITDHNIRNIDIGLYEAEKFDLRLDKYITKTTLSTPTIGTKTTTYDNEKIAKTEVLSKNLGKSSVIIEYKIVVTNQGSVPGYVKKIVDYLPKNVNFYSEINKDWFLAEDGNVYNSSLENTVINPGESKEVTIILSKTITENSLGTLNNTAEIYESYNELGLEDINSEAGNKAENENDISKADIVLSIVTGGIVVYGVIALVVVSILAFGITAIKKKVLNKN